MANSIEETFGWHKENEENEIFVRKPRLSRTPPSASKGKDPRQSVGRLESVDLAGEETEEEVNIIKQKCTQGKAIEGVTNQKRKESLTLEEKVDVSLRAIEKILQAISDHHMVFNNLILKKEDEIDPVITNTYVSMKKCLEEVMVAVDGLRDVHTKHTEKTKGEMTYSKTKRAQTTVMTETDRIPVTEKKSISTQTEEEIGGDFPPLPAVRQQKRKEITPPTDKSGKRTRFTRNAEESPMEKGNGKETLMPGQGGGVTSGEQEWIVAGRRRRTKEEEVGSNRSSATPNKNKNEGGRPASGRAGGRNTPRINIKPQAIAVRFGKDKTFAEILKKVKGAAGKTPEGIRAVKQTRAGNLLIEFAPGADLENLRRNLDGRLGSDVEVAKLQTMVDIEIRGIDPTVEKEEVMEAIKGEIGHEAKGVRIKILRTDPRQNKVAVIEGPAVDMNRLLRGNKIRIGWTMVTAREIPRLTRCYKCHGMGHIANNCKIIGDTGGLCRKCGDAGHHMRECVKEPRCRLCVADGLPAEQTGHVAASVRCPKYKEALRNKRQG
ncbi:uncharacterized protein LOC123988991 [Osmia bicornis bicornis]|uniref:uncharacterized protein LOC123988813 n=1 Tax=Osmia bicornis bicornis TaxID=1437191 RepID=UPI001EAEBC13|nr:uncharacterized protein LOC123988813 [Osmia bicornis bicornis]XP_046145676.1 uncharacterized protein LOC123988991 [Osmia bicornis bicornis]